MARHVGRCGGGESVQGNLWNGVIESLSLWNKALEQGSKSHSHLEENTSMSAFWPTANVLIGLLQRRNGQTYAIYKVTAVIHFISGYIQYMYWFVEARLALPQSNKKNNLQH